MTLEKDTEHKNGQMEANMKDCGRRIKRGERENL